MDTKFVEMTVEQRKKFEAFLAQEDEKEQEAKKMADREAYKELIDATIKNVFPSLRVVSVVLGALKKRVYDEFNQALAIKASLYGVKEGQQSHMFTTTDGKFRIMLGYNVTDDYDDTVNEGIKKVHDYISSLAKDEDTQTLVNAVLRLLAKDGKTGTLKASRVLQLLKMAEDSRNTDFIDGVNIIQSAYRPAISKQYIKAQFKTDLNEWESVSLAMTEANKLLLCDDKYKQMIDDVNVDLLNFIYNNKQGIKIKI